MDKKDKKLLKSAIEENNSKKIYELILKQNISIEDLKKEEFLIDRRGISKYKILLSQLKILFKSNNEFDRLFNEIQCLNELFEESALLQSQIDSLPSKYIFSLLLHKLDINIAYLKSDSNKIICKNNNLDYYINYDNCASVINNTIKSLCYNEKIYKNNQFLYSNKISYVITCKKKYHKLLDSYINDSVSTGYLEDYLSYWKNNIISITKNNYNISISITNKDKLLKSCYIQLKQILYNYIYEIPAIIKIGNRKVSQSKFLFEVSFNLLEQYFSANIEDIIVEEIPIKEWIFAYYALVDISNKNNEFFSKTSLTSLIFNKNKPKTKKAWCKILIKYGVSKCFVEKIFDKMIYNKTSTDLYDYPFIKVKNKYLVFMEMLKNCDPAKAIISRFSRQDINVDFKGKNFENKFYNFCNYKDIKFVKLHNIKDREEYECDAVLYIENTLIFCELKSRNQYRNFEYNSVDVDEDIAQLNRIYEYYKENLDIVKNAFKDKYNINLNKRLHLKKLIIYSRAVDGCIRKNNVVCIDYLKFIIPFLPVVVDEYFKDEKLKNIFCEKFSIKNVFEFYEYSFYIFNYRDSMEIKKHNFNIGKYIVNGEIVSTKEFINFSIECKLISYVRDLKERGYDKIIK